MQSHMGDAGSEDRSAPGKPQGPAFEKKARWSIRVWPAARIGRLCRTRLKPALVYLPVINNGGVFRAGKVRYIKGQMFMGSSMTAVDNEAHGHVKAIDVKTGEIRWEKKNALTHAGRYLDHGRRHRLSRGIRKGTSSLSICRPAISCGSFSAAAGTTPRRSPMSWTASSTWAVCVGWGGPGAKYNRGAPWFAGITRGCAVYVFRAAGLIRQLTPK